MEKIPSNSDGRFFDSNYLYSNIFKDIFFILVLKLNYKCNICLECFPDLFLEIIGNIIYYPGNGKSNSYEPESFF